MASSEVFELMDVASLLARARSFPWDSSVYFPPEGPTSLESQCAVIRDDTSLYGDPEPHPKADQHGLQESMGLQDVQMVLDNAENQAEAVTTEQLLRALQHYIQHDSYLSLR